MSDGPLTSRGTPKATNPEPRRVLVLHIEVPGVWVDDLDETAEEYFRGDYLDAVTDHDGMGLDRQVGLTVVVHGDESGPMVHAYTCRVVGAATKEARRGDQG